MRADERAIVRFNKDAYICDHSSSLTVLQLDRRRHGLNARSFRSWTISDHMRTSVPYMLIDRNKKFRSKVRSVHNSISWIIVRGSNDKMLEL